MASQIKWQPGDFRKGDRVEVKMKGPPGAPFIWKGGRITEVTGRRGLFVKLDEGNTNFFFYSDIRPEAVPPKAPDPPKMPKPVPRAIATIGDALAARQTEVNKGLAKVVPPPAPPAPAKPEPPIEPAQSKRTLHRHPTSAIGNVFRAYRVREGVTQQALADLVGLSNSYWSKIELGSADPNDQVLARFAELTGMPLAELKAARDREPITDVTALAPVPAAVAPAANPMPGAAPPQPEPPPAPVAAPVAPPAPTSAPGEGFEDFVDRLDAVVPIPASKETRRRWFAIARELHGMKGDG